MKNMTFRDIYKKECDKPTPRQKFIAEIARVTKKSENTVKQWGNGIQAPDELTRNVLAAHFGCDPVSLFPGNKQ